MLHSEVCAKEPFPSFRAAMKDGYAVIASDGAGERSVISSSLAGFDVCYQVLDIKESTEPLIHNSTWQGRY